MASSPGSQSNVEDMFEVLEITDLRGKDLNNILLVDSRRAQDRDHSGGGVWFVFPFGDNVIDLLSSEGGEGCSEGSDEARCAESIFLQTGFEEDGISEHRRGLCDSGVLEGDDEDSLLGGKREGA